MWPLGFLANEALFFSLRPPTFHYTKGLSVPIYSSTWSVITGDPLLQSHWAC